MFATGAVVNVATGLAAGTAATGTGAPAGNCRENATSIRFITLGAAAKSDDRIIRQSIQLALPKIAGKDCKQCGPKLDEAIAAGEGKTTLGDLNYETTVLRSFWGEAPAEAVAP